MKNNSEIRNFKRQKGLVLIITLLVLTVMILSSVAMLRTLNTSTVAAQGYSFRSAGNAFTVPPIKDRIKWLTQTYATTSGKNDLAGLGTPVAGYSAVYLDEDNEMGIPSRLLEENPTGVMTYKNGDFGVTEAGNYNTAYVVIERLCSKTGQPRMIRKYCVGTEPSGLSDEHKNNVSTHEYNYLFGSFKVAYRITVRVDSPGNAVAFGQAIINL